MPAMGVDGEGIKCFWAAAKLAALSDGVTIKYFWAYVASRYLSMQGGVPMDRSTS